MRKEVWLVLFLFIVVLISACDKINSSGLNDEEEVNINKATPSGIEPTVGETGVQPPKPKTARANKMVCVDIFDKYFEDLLDRKEECDHKENQDDKNKCFDDISEIDEEQTKLIWGDMNSGYIDCKKIEDQKTREVCLSGSGEGPQNFCICDEYKEEDQKGNCDPAINDMLIDLNLCEKSGIERYLNVCLDFIYLESAKITLATSYCDKISNQEGVGNCYYEISIIE